MREREGEGGGRENKRWRKKKERTPRRSNNGEKASYPHRGSAELLNSVSVVKYEKSNIGVLE